MVNFSEAKYPPSDLPVSKICANLWTDLSEFFIFRLFGLSKSLKDLSRPRTSSKNWTGPRVGTQIFLLATEYDHFLVGKTSLVLFESRVGLQVGPVGCILDTGLVPEFQDFLFGGMPCALRWSWDDLQLVPDIFFLATGVISR